MDNLFLCLVSPGGVRGPHLLPRRILSGPAPRNINTIEIERKRKGGREEMRG